jgi:hypothetical protein
MSDSNTEKQKVTICAQDGEERDYTVNQDGTVNANAVNFVNNHGGPVGKDVKVDTPVKFDGEKFKVR